MEGDLIKRCERLKINDAEIDVFDTTDLGGEGENGQVSLLLVGRIVTEKNFNVEAFKRTMIQAWGLTKRVVIRMIGPNKFVFQFFHWKDKNKVMEGRPWCFDNQSLVLNNISGNDQPSEVT